ncbi:hypothetical protein [Synoicihabitans lomoniglobus]|uniref:Uncharacterized protein n=1 Tax=Synoicihabitans lomoniglobus TaxID=2909285 RepID=A0AAF0CNE8_9BACT|nr:hypothetical protein [Opitutaceae bacterium LMO-M01]WED64476.1 hypothetical protein PXH66_19220 [Opitutaceae bacterium LMO-M01]
MSNKNFIVLWAVYGTKDRSTDVSKKVQGFVEKHFLKYMQHPFDVPPPDFKVHNDMLGDPDPGHSKHFAMSYNYNGMNMYRACAEGETLDLSQCNNIYIEGAIYGAKKGGFDVTQKVRQMVDQVGETKIRASNHNFGDPAPGNGKHLGIVYRVGNKTFHRACKEGQTLQLS